jgi:hypothetical protein
MVGYLLYTVHLDADIKISCCVDQIEPMGGAMPGIETDSSRQDTLDLGFSRPSDFTKLRYMLRT